MIFSANTIERLPFAYTRFDAFLRGVPWLIAFLLYIRRGNSRGALGSQMSQSIKGLEMGFQSKAGIVLPATGDHVEVAVNAIKDGQVIAVPTDTIYGFACDAW